MRKHPVRLVTYFYPRVNLEANVDFNPKTDERNPDIRPKVEYVVLQHKDESTRWQIQIWLNFEPVPDAYQLPYYLDVHVVGVFQVDEEIKTEDRPLLVFQNGAGILYSAIREYLLGMTARGPWGTITLPVMGVDEFVVLETPNDNSDELY